MEGKTGKMENHTLRISHVQCPYQKMDLKSGMKTDRNFVEL